MIVMADKNYTEYIIDALTDGGRRPLPFEIHDGGPIDAYVNHGRWVADCACNGAELVAPDQEMVCGSCGARNTVTFPGPKTREKIEAALKVRPPLRQNWYPDETVDELIAQNIEHGIYPEDL
jgi:hypothetical protein